MSIDTREAVTIRREMEFFSEPELSKQLGYTRSNWPAVGLKELIDNALDHLEEIGRSPRIWIDVKAGDHITVIDNGDGIPDSVIAGLSDFSTRTSSRVCYRSPTRGSQGNAGKCLVAMPYVWGDGYVEVTRSTGKLRISATVDDILQAPSISVDPVEFVEIDSFRKHDWAGFLGDQGVLEMQELEESGSSDEDSEHGVCSCENWSKLQIGTAATIVLPGFTNLSAYSIVSSYAAVNPHATFVLTVDGKRYDWASKTDKPTKWTTRKPDQIGWYSPIDFLRLLRSSSGTVSEVVRGFASVTTSAARKELLGRLGLNRCKAAEISEESAKKLHAEIARLSPEFDPKSLGFVGKRQVEDALARWGANDIFYKKDAGVSGGMPFSAEVAFGYSESQKSRIVVSSVNGSPDIVYSSIKCVNEIAESMRLDSECKSVLFVSVTTPSPKFTDRGKTVLQLDPPLVASLEKMIRAVLKDHLREVKQRDRGARNSKRASRSDGIRKVRDAVMELLPRSIEVMSQGGKAPFDARSHFYWMRDNIQSLVGSVVINQKLLDRYIDEWEEENGVIKLRQRDPRGFLYVPHTGETIPLGTQNVSNYEIQEHEFHSLMYIEKKGLLEILKYHQIPEKYDIAVMAAEGYSTRAGQQLLQRAAEMGKRTIVFHDADPSGYGISNSLGRQSGAHRFKYEVVDAGLHIADALKMGLKPEYFERQSSLNSEIKWTDLELDYFTGKEVPYERKNGKESRKWVNCRRFELNAISCDPPKFIKWIETKLKEHGFARKLIPSNEVIAQAIDLEFMSILKEKLKAEVLSQIDFDDIVSHAFEILNESKLAKPKTTSVTSRAKKMEPIGWRSMVKDAVLNRISTMSDDISDAVETSLKEML